MMAARSSPAATMGNTTLACDMVRTMARVAAMARREVPSFSIMEKVATGAAKLTRSNCTMAKAPAPGTPKIRSTGRKRRAARARMPRASASFISAIMTTSTGNSV